MNTEQDHDATAGWAENDLSLIPGSTTALPGRAAGDLGRGLLERAAVGRPSLAPIAGPGHRSRVRQLRVPADFGARPDARVQAQSRRVPTSCETPSPSTSVPTGRADDWPRAGGNAYRVIRSVE